MTDERGSYGDYSVDEEDQPGAEDTIPDANDPEDALDPGYSPPERYSPGQGYGNTAWEEEHRESIEQRLRQEVPDRDPYAEDGSGDEDVDDGEVGDQRAGRLVDPDEGVREDDEKELYGYEVGVDGAGASAEEAAVHIIDDSDEDSDEQS